MRKLLLALILSASYITVNAQVGHLDSTFGTNGLVRTALGGNGFPASKGLEVFLHPDGSFYLSLSASGIDVHVAHFMANGTLDQNFGEGGYSVIIPRMGDEARTVIQSDGKIVIGSYIDHPGNFDFMLVRLTANGFLDSSFSGDGLQVTDVSGFGKITALALQSDGKIVAGGFGDMVRYHPDGSLDSGFSGDGRLSGIGGPINSIAIQTDGKILIAYNAFVSRYLPDGSLDNEFGSGGTVSFTFVTPYALMKSVKLQNDGKIVVGGGGQTAIAHEDFIIGRLNSNGSFDNSFSEDGIQITNFGGISFGEALAIQDDGKILLTGRYSVSGAIRVHSALARYNSNGSLDNSFSGDGKLISSVQEIDFATSIALQADSKIMLAGYSNSVASHYYFAERLFPNGDLDAGLDGDGILIGFKPVGYTSFNCSAVQTDGKVVAAGYTQSKEGGGLAIARYNKDGSLDSSFSQEGSQTLNSQSANATINAISIQADGKIVIAGHFFAGTTYLDFDVARFNVNGTLDSSFSGDGIVGTDFNGDDDAVISMVLQPDGKIVVAGGASFDRNWDLALARYNIDGTLDYTFSGDGKLVIDFDRQFNYAQSVLVQPDGKIVAVGNYSSYDSSDLVLIRLNPDGSFDPLFDGDGILITDIGEGLPESAFAAALQNDGKIVVAGEIYIPELNYHFLIVRYNSDGSFDTSFSNDGKLAFNLGSTGETAYSIALQKDGKILVGGSFNEPSTTNLDFGLIRLNQNGTPDFSFSDDGIATPEFPYGEDAIRSLSISGNRVYAVGFTTYGSLYGAVAAFRIFDEPIDPLIVTIPDAYALHDGVDANTVYIGYEPASKIRLHAEPSGGKEPYSYLWSTGATTASIKVSPIVNTNYSVTVTDALGNKISASKMIKVVDVRCGNKSDKVLICQKEHGHSNRSVTICVSVYAVWAHLKNGSTLGRCQPSEETHYLTVFAYPNPTKNYFNLSIKSDQTIMADLTVWNVLGKVVERKSVNTNSIVQIGAGYRPGLYFAEVKTKNRKERIKLLKLPH